jgi:hypothetical protein
MVFPRMRAWVAGLLFLGWLGFLAYLAIGNWRRIVVARPQLERSNFVVVATLTDADGRPAAEMRIQKVLYSEKLAWRQLAGQSLELNELVFFSENQGWQGPGDYVVPLTRTVDEETTRDQVTLLPLSPGYFPATSEVKIEVGNRPDSLARHVAAFTETPSRRLRELFNAPVATICHVPLRTREEFARVVHDAGGRVLGAHMAEARIYRATDDVLQQVDAMVR